MSIVLPDGTEYLFSSDAANLPSVKEMKLADGRILYMRGVRNITQDARDIDPDFDVKREEPDILAQYWHTKNDLRILASMDKVPHGQLLHVSVAYQHRDPTWKELVNIKELFFGDVDAGLIMPRLADFVKGHVHSFHIWQLPKRWGIK